MALRLPATIRHGKVIGGEQLCRLYAGGRTGF
jgi:hypothetical protein